MANTDDMLEGRDTQVGPNTRLGSEIHDIKTVGDVTVVNHDCSTTMNVGSDIKAVRNSAIVFYGVRVRRRNRWFLTYIDVPK